MHYGKIYAVKEYKGYLIILKAIFWKYVLSLASPMPLSCNKSQQAFCCVSLTTFQYENSNSAITSKGMRNILSLPAISSVFLDFCNVFQNFRHDMKLSYRNICWSEDCSGHKCWEQEKNNCFLSADHKRELLLLLANMTIKRWKWL